MITMKIIGNIRHIKAGLNSLYMQYFSPLNKNGYGKKGRNSIIKNNSIINKKNIFIDDWAVIQDQTNFISLHGKLRIGKYSVISSGCTIIPDAHKITVGIPFYINTMNHVNDESSDIIIEEDCWVGAGCILLPHTYLKRGSIVGAGSVVNKEVPPYAVVAGIPAKIIATKFTIEQILKHESILYPPEERISRSEIELLFSERYRGLKAIGLEYIDNNVFQEIDSIRGKYGMTNYQDY